MRLGITAQLALLALSLAAPAGAQLSDEGLLAADAEQQRIIEDEDLEAQRAFMHDNYIINAPAGRVMRKADALALMAAGGVASDSFERTVEGYQITGNVGVVVGREEVVPASGSNLARQFGGETLQRRFINVFLFEDGRWRFLARQATVVPPEAPERP